MNGKPCRTPGCKVPVVEGVGGGWGYSPWQGLCRLCHLENVCKPAWVTDWARCIGDPCKKTQSSREGSAMGIRCNSEGPMSFVAMDRAEALAETALPRAVRRQRQLRKEQGVLRRQARDETAELLHELEVANRRLPPLSLVAAGWDGERHYLIAYHAKHWTKHKQPAAGFVLGTFGWDAACRKGDALKSWEHCRCRECSTPFWMGHFQNYRRLP